MKTVKLTRIVVASMPLIYQDSDNQYIILLLRAAAHQEERGLSRFITSSCVQGVNPSMATPIPELKSACLCIQLLDQNQGME